MGLLAVPVIIGFGQFGLDSLFTPLIATICLAPLVASAITITLALRMIRCRVEVLALDSTGIVIGGHKVAWGDVGEISLSHLGRDRFLEVHPTADDAPGNTLKRAVTRAVHSRRVLLADIDSNPDELLRIIRDVAIEGGVELDEAPGRRDALKARQIE